MNPSIVDQVFAKNRLQDYCSPDAFHSGFVVQESSPSLQFLNLEYEARLSDARLTPIDRQRLLEEYASRRATLQSHYRLTFIQPRECKQVSQPIVSKALLEILETWASDAGDKRGVLNLRVPTLIPGIFDQDALETENLLVRADLVRTAVARVIANIIAVENPHTKRFVSSMR